MKISKVLVTISAIVLLYACGENSQIKNDSEEGKGKNRRTEIILSPDLQDIYNILKTK